MPKYKVSIPKRDLKVLRFLWRWKLVSSSALFAKYYANRTPASAYNKLNSLRKNGLIQTTYITNHEGFAWSLTAKGFAFIKDELPELVNSSHKSDKKNHDFLVTAFHYGDWLLDLPEWVELLSEQKLKCYHPQFLPSWVPDPTTHRPDGYWKINPPDGSGATIIALEVELTQKSTPRYFKVKDFYAHYQQVQFVVWVTPNLVTAKRLMAIISEKSPSSRNPHQFVTAADFRQKGWNSLIVLGTEAGKSFQQFLADLGGTMAVQTRFACTSENLLDLALKPLKPTPYQPTPKPQNR